MYGSSAIDVMARLGLAVPDGAGPAVAGAVMDRSGGSGVNPQEGRTGTGLCGVVTGKAGTSSVKGVREVSRANSVARALSVADVAVVGRKVEARGSSVEVTGTGAQYAGVGWGEGGGGVNRVRLCPGLGFLRLGE